MFHLCLLLCVIARCVANVMVMDCCYCCGVFGLLFLFLLWCLVPLHVVVVVCVVFGVFVVIVMCKCCLFGFMVLAIVVLMKCVDVHCM